MPDANALADIVLLHPKMAPVDWQRLIWACDGRVSSRARLAFVVLAAYADLDGTNAYPSVPTIAMAMGEHPSTARRGLKDLRRLGIIDGDPDESRGYSTAYSLTFERLIEYVDLDSRFLNDALRKTVEAALARKEMNE